MVIFTKELKRQKNLFFVFLAVLFITALVLWYGFFRPSPKVESIEPAGQMGTAGPVEEVKEIDFSVLESPFLKEIQLLEEIKAFEGKIGRENPFILYY